MQTNNKKPRGGGPGAHEGFTLATQRRDLTPARQETLAHPTSTKLADVLTAEAAYYALRPDDSDDTIVDVLADYLTTKNFQPPYRLELGGDGQRRGRRRNDEWGLPLVDESTYRISTSDRDEAKRWTAKALRAGRSVYVLRYKNSVASGGSIRTIRERRAGGKS
jgi:hypothetical protein